MRSSSAFLHSHMTPLMMQAITCVEDETVQTLDSRLVSCGSDNLTGGGLADASDSYG